MRVDHKETWAPKNWCFQTVMLDMTLESPLDCKEIKPVHPKGDQSWVFIGRTDVDAETPMLWPPDGKNRLIVKDPDAGNDWRGEEKGMAEDEISWMASLTQWTWIWVNSGSWWWTGKPGMLQCTGSQRVGHDWVTELTELSLRKRTPFSLLTKMLDRKWRVCSGSFGSECQIFQKRKHIFFHCNRKNSLQISGL